MTTPTTQPSPSPTDAAPAAREGAEGAYLGALGLVTQIGALPFTLAFLPLLLAMTPIAWVYVAAIVSTGLILGTLAIAWGRTAGRVQGAIAILAALGALAWCAWYQPLA